MRVGYPRRHYTLPDNELRAASGKLLLIEDLPASGGIDPSSSSARRRACPRLRSGSRSTAS